MLEIELTDKEKEYCKKYHRNITIEPFKALYLKRILNKEGKELYSSIIDINRINWQKESS